MSTGKVVPVSTMNACGQLYTHGELTLMPTTMDAGWVSETVFILPSRKNPLTPLRIKSRFLGCPACSLVTILTKLPWLLLY